MEILQIPEDILIYEILLRVSTSDIINLCRVNRSFRRLYETPEFWRKKIKLEYPGILQLKSPDITYYNFYQLLYKSPKIPIYHLGNVINKIQIPFNDINHGISKISLLPIPEQYYIFFLNNELYPIVVVNPDKSERKFTPFVDINTENTLISYILIIQADDEESISFYLNGIDLSPNIPLDFTMRLILTSFVKNPNIKYPVYGIHHTDRNFSISFPTIDEGYPISCYYLSDFQLLEIMYTLDLPPLPYNPKEIQSIDLIRKYLLFLGIGTKDDLRKLHPDKLLFYYLWEKHLNITIENSLEVHSKVYNIIRTRLEEIDQYII